MNTKFNLLTLITFSISTVIVQGQNTILAGWYDWDASGRVNDNTPDEIEDGFAAITGINVESANSTIGGGNSVLTNTNSNLTFTWPGTASTTNSAVLLRPSINSQRSLDFQITNNTGVEYSLTGFQFQYRKAETTTPAGTAITLAHLDGTNNLSDLNVNNASVMATDVPSVNYAWYNVSVDLTTLSDNVIAPGERAAFRLSVPALSRYVNWNVDNVAISGAIVPEPKTYALFLGSLVLLFGWYHRRR